MTGKVDDTIRLADRLMMKLRSRGVAREIETRIDELSVDEATDRARVLIQQCEDALEESRRTVSLFPVEHRRAS